MSFSALVSHCPGRLRLRDSRWRSKPLLDALITNVEAIDGVLRLEPNPLAGSLLIIYDPARLTPAALLASLAPLLGEEAPTPPAVAVSAPRTGRRWTLPEVGPDANRAAKIGYFAATGLTVAALGFNRKMHAAAGWASLGFLAVHLFHHRRKMLR